MENNIWTHNLFHTKQEIQSLVYHFRVHDLCSFTTFDRHPKLLESPLWARKLGRVLTDGLRVKRGGTWRYSWRQGRSGGRRILRPAWACPRGLPARHTTPTVRSTRHRHAPPPHTSDTSLLTTRNALHVSTVSAIELRPNTEDVLFNSSSLPNHSYIISVHSTLQILRLEIVITLCFKTYRYCAYIWFKINRK